MVRVWNYPIHLLDIKRLLGQHNESGIMFSAILRYRDTGLPQSYYNHPQTKRFHDNPGILMWVHDACVATERFNHKSPLLDKHSSLEYLFAFPDGFKVEPHTYTRSEFLSDLVKLRSRKPGYYR